MLIEPGDNVWYIEATARWVNVGLILDSLIGREIRHVAAGDVR